MAQQPDFFDAEALGVANLGVFVDSVPKRTGKKLKASAEEKAERKAAEAGKDNAPSATPHAITVALMLDPAVREIEGRQLHAELGRRKAAPIVERQATLKRGPSNPERTAEIATRFADKPLSYECKQACNQIGEDYVFGLERLRFEIDALDAEQIEISWAYARPEFKAGYIAMSAWVEAASAAAEAKQQKAACGRMERETTRRQGKRAPCAASKHGFSSRRDRRRPRSWKRQRRQSRVRRQHSKRRLGSMRANASRSSGMRARNRRPGNEPRSPRTAKSKPRRTMRPCWRRDRPKARLRLPRRRPRSRSPTNPSPRPRRKPNPSPIRRRGQNLLSAPLRTSSIGLTRRNAPRAPKTPRRSRRLCMRSRPSTPRRRCGSWRNGRTTRRD